MKKLLCSLLLLGVGLTASGQGTDFIGRADTVGGTTYDFQPKMTARFDSGYGLHVVWAYSADARGSYPDLNARYNFYDLSLLPPAWAFNQGPDFMLWGVNVFAGRWVFGNLDVSPRNHCAYISYTWTEGGSLAVGIARDQAPGAGSFLESPGPVDNMFPLLSIGQSGRTHVVMESTATPHALCYSGVETSLVWSGVSQLNTPLPDLENPAYWIAASRRSAKVTALWTDRNRIPPHIYYRQSTDDGADWFPPDSIPLPPAFHPGSDTLPVVIDLYPWYDPDEEDEDAVHVAASLIPVLGESVSVTPAEIWHWSEAAGWNQITRAGCSPGHLQGSTGYDAYAGRPSLGYDRSLRQWICAWEQFDSTNVESLTGQLRADIWSARGDSTGQHWGPPVRLTDPDRTSKRFPCVANDVYQDTCAVLYEVDLIAGFAVHGVGPNTDNPIVVQWVPISAIPPPTHAGLGYTPLVPLLFHVIPNPVTSQTCIRYSLSSAEPVKIKIMDAAGRVAVRLEQGVLPAGAYSVKWNGRDELGNRLPPGCYFCTLKTGNRTATAKIILNR